MEKKVIFFICLGISITQYSDILADIPSFGKSEIGIEPSIDQYQMDASGDNAYTSQLSQAQIAALILAREKAHKELYGQNDEVVPEEQVQKSWWSSMYDKLPSLSQAVSYGADWGLTLGTSWLATKYSDWLNDPSSPGMMPEFIKASVHNMVGGNKLLWGRVVKEGLPLVYNAMMLPSI